MKVTFPHFGSTWVALKALFDKNGVECVVPPMTNRRTLSLGVKYSPETMCLPYKMLLGNIIEGLELGADTVINVGGPGLCRLGCYSKLHEQALRDLGFNFEMIIFDWQDQQIIGLVKCVRKALDTDKPWIEVVGDVKFGLQQLILMDDLERHLHHVRPRALDRRAVTKIWRGAGERVSAAHTPEALRKVRRDLFHEFDSVPQDADARPLRVGLLGEFFMAIDSFCNMDIELEFGERGVEVVRSAYLMNWAKAWLFLEALGMSHDKEVKKAASPYLSRDVSGDAIQSLGETILHRNEGFDGIVHIMPFTCLPEIIAQNIFPKVVKDHNIPVLSVVLDEQMGKAGLLTRLEAFVDLMERHRARLAS
ncbi:MAG: CoA protein activase [Chloroflexota bacterium]